MELLISHPLSADENRRIESVVSRALGDRASTPLRVYVNRSSAPGWSVFVLGLPEHPLALEQSIERALNAPDL